MHSCAQRRVRECECGHAEIREGAPFVCPDCGGVIARAAREPLSEAEFDRLTGQVFARVESRHWMAEAVRRYGVCGVVRLAEIRERLARERQRWGQGELPPG